MSAMPCADCSMDGPGSQLTPLNSRLTPTTTQPPSRHTPTAGRQTPVSMRTVNRNSPTGKLSPPESVTLQPRLSIGTSASPISGLPKREASFTFLEEGPEGGAGGQLLEKLRGMKGYIKMDARAASPAKIRSPDLDPVRFRRTRPQRCVCSCWKM